MSRLCRLKSASHGEDGQWAYEEIVRLREKLDYANAVIEQRNMEADRLQVENDALEKDRNDWIACHARMFKQRDELRAENEALRKDAERYKALAEYLASADTSRDDDIVACSSVAELSAVLDSMKGQ